MHTKGRGTKLWENSVEVNFFFFLTKNARDLLHSTVPSIVLKGKLCLGSTGFSSMLHHELPLAKLYHHRAVRAAATVAIFQTTFPPSIHLSPAYGKLEIPGEGCSLCLWCGNDMEVQHGAALRSNSCDSAPAKNSAYT